MSQNVRLQNLRDFTVQIRRVVDDAAEGDLIGTGVAVSMDGKIVTCAHVVEGALGVHPRQANGAEVGVYFPQARGGETKARRATVAACFPQHDDDVVLLQLTGGPSPLAPEQVVRLGKAQASNGHPFRSYGYRSLGKYEAGYAYGRILGCVECPEDLALQADPVQLESQHIAPGMSGSPVLDIERNLVVGVISETWYTDQLGKDRDTGWAVDAHVLTFDPLNLPVQDEPYPLGAAPQPRADPAAVHAAVGPRERIAWNNAPPSLKEWVGRDDLLRSVTRDWANPNRRVTGLIGFGGEGKSSLARKWVDDLLSPLPSYSTGEGAGVGGVFWWGFYEKPSVDEFFEAALKYMSGDRIDPRTLPSADAKAHFIAAMLATGRYLFVLDGLEVMQHQEGDPYGLLKSADLREFLSYFTAPGHASFCLVTSRAPLLDLMEYTTYTHRDVDRLSAADGRDLLRKVGVRCADAQADAQLDKLVADWDGHALTLSLLGGLLVEQYGGDVAHVADLPVPVAGEPRYERVHRVLRRYDEHLTESERAFLTLFSAFRTPVHESAFDKVFRPMLPSPEIGRGVGGEGDDAAFNAMVARLVKYRILRHDAATHEYTTHPLIRAHYFALLTQGDPSQTQAAHERIKDYYLEMAGDTPQYPTLDDLRPLIEVVHHACRAGAYDEAYRVLQDRIYQGWPGRVLVNQLGAWETALALMFEFFPNGDTSQDPQMSKPFSKRWILNEIGLCLMYLGRLSEAPPFQRQGAERAVAEQDWHNASLGYINLAELYAYLGELAKSAQVAQQALDLARRAENKQDERNSLAYQTWAAHLRGELEAASVAFAQAEVLERDIYSSMNIRYLFSVRGIVHADHLRRTGQADYARRVTDANLEICRRNHWEFLISMCHRVLGDLDADAGQLASARGHYDEALKIARGISHRPSLIEALLARGRFFARQANLAKVQATEGRPPSQGLGSAFDDLNEVLGYAVAGGYRIYEVDIRIALAWAHLNPHPHPPPSVTGEGVAQARAEAERALQMSEAMGYYWGKVDAQEVLSRMAG